MSDFNKYECAEFKSELENFVSPNTLKGKEMKDVRTNIVLL
jgi:hypothetical protein